MFHTDKKIEKYWTWNVLNVIVLQVSKSLYCCQLIKIESKNIYPVRTFTENR